MRRGSSEVILLVACCLVLVMAIAIYLFAWPQYRVWQQGMEGKAALMRAEQEKQIEIEQAKAEVESARLRAEAIQIVGKASQDFPEYRKQEFIGAFAEAMKNGQIQKIIYVPTEANIPIIDIKH